MGAINGFYASVALFAAIFLVVARREIVRLAGVFCQDYRWVYHGLGRFALTLKCKVRDALSDDKQFHTPPAQLTLEEWLAVAVRALGQLKDRVVDAVVPRALGRGVGGWVFHHPLNCLAFAGLVTLMSWGVTARRATERQAAQEAAFWSDISLATSGVQYDSQGVPGVVSRPKGLVAFASCEQRRRAATAYAEREFYRGALVESDPEGERVRTVRQALGKRDQARAELATMQDEIATAKGELPSCRDAVDYCIEARFAGEGEVAPELLAEAKETCLQKLLKEHACRQPPAAPEIEEINNEEDQCTDCKQQATGPQKSRRSKSSHHRRGHRSPSG